MKDVTIIPSDNPGAFERHLIRRADNLLFTDRKTSISSDTLMEVQQKDHEILQQFMLDFRDVMTKAVSLNHNEDSDVILEIKDKLDKLYATSVTVADDQTRVKDSIKKLLAVVMGSVRKGAGEDAHALQELDQEEEARKLHFEFLESKLVADILDPDSPIENDDLIPTLLSSTKDDLALACQLFDEQQMTFLLAEGKKLLDILDAQGQDVQSAAENYVFMEGYLQFLQQEQQK